MPLDINPNICRVGVKMTRNRSFIIIDVHYDLACLMVFSHTRDTVNVLAKRLPNCETIGTLVNRGVYMLCAILSNICP